MHRGIYKNQLYNFTLFSNPKHAKQFIFATGLSITWTTGFYTDTQMTLFHTVKKNKTWIRYKILIVILWKYGTLCFMYIYGFTIKNIILSFIPYVTKLWKWSKEKTLSVNNYCLIKRFPASKLKWRHSYWGIYNLKFGQAILITGVYNMRKKNGGSDA